MMRSLRLQLLAGVIGAVTLLLIVFSVTVYAAIRHTLMDQFDAALTSSARMLAASVERDANEVELGFDAEQIREFNDAKRPTYYEMLRSDGRVVAKSPSLGRTDLPRFEGAIGREVFRTLALGDERPGRAVSLKFVPRLADTEGEPPQQSPGKAPFTLVVARSTHDVQEQLESLRFLLAAASAGVIGLSLLAGGLVVVRGLRPLNAFAAQIAAISEDNLSARVKDLSAPAEIEPVRDRLNDLLTRLEASFNRERRFAADVAHELRTPLAGIRSTLEVTLMRQRRSEEYRASLEDCLAISTGMQTMVNNLLMLARIDARQVALQFEPIQAAALVDSCWRPFAIAAAKRGIEFENRLSAEMTLRSDRSCLSMVFSNLLDNAVEYTDQGGRIWVAGQCSTDAIEVTVANTGCQLTREQVPQVFDCFWRGDPSRTATGTHCGLGLALVRRIVDSLSGRVSADVQEGETFAVRLVLPMRR